MELSTVIQLTHRRSSEIPHIPPVHHGVPVQSTEGEPSGTMNSMRIDKWLWAARFFKTRAIAIRSCEMGRIEANGLRAKPAREVRPGDRLRIENEAGIFAIEILELSQMRGPAAEAQKLFRETDESRAARLKVAEERKSMLQFAPEPARRPSKRDRRHIIRFRGDG